MLLKLISLMFSVIKAHCLDFLIVLGLTIYSVAMWWPTRYLPFHWDSAGFYINAAKTLVENNFSPLVAAHSDFAHPPLLILISAIIWKLTSGSIIAQHLLMLPFLPVILISTFVIGKKVKNSLLGLASATVMAVLPVTLAEYGVIYIDLPAAALTTLSIALFVHKRYLASVIALTVAVLTKETVILILPLFFFLAFQESIKIRDYLFRLLLTPVAAILVYWFYHLQVVGWFLIAPEGQLPHRFSRSLNDLQTSAVNIANSLALDDNRWLLFIPGIAALVYIWYKHRSLLLKSKGKIVSGFVGTVILNYLAFVFLSEFAPRYGLYFYPIAIVAMLWGIDTFNYLAVSKNTTWYTTIVTVLIAVTFIKAWYPPKESVNEFDFRPPDNLSYIDIIRTHQMLGLYLQLYHPNAKIYGAFPENTYLQQTYQGYVGQPLSFGYCKDFEPSNETVQLIIVHRNSPLTLDCLNLANTYTLKQLQHFESGTQFIDVYERVSTPSANRVD